VLRDNDATAPDDLSRVHDQDQLERGFRQLSIEHRAVVVLHTYLGLSLEEIADTLGTPRGTIRSRLHYAVRAMRAALDADERPALREIAP
jgi:RNA polymerase sigma-70 factor, ECF subfamily